MFNYVYVFVFNLFIRCRVFLVFLVNRKDEVEFKFLKG